jgi:HlyD family secretion protein
LGTFVKIGVVLAAVGQQTNSQQGVATIITKDKVAEISLNEIDVVNVKLGQPVELTFDAIPGETFTGTVSQINTVGVSTSNVVSFATKISIPDADERIKSGMSVTANIIVENKEGVLSVPSGTVKSENVKGEMKYYVMKKTQQNQKVYVAVGMTNDIDTEIVEGLNEGDQVVSRTVSGTTAKSTSSTSIFSLFGGGNRMPGTGGGNGGTRTITSGGNSTR